MPETLWKEPYLDLVSVLFMTSGRTFDDNNGHQLIVCLKSSELFFFLNQLRKAIDL